MISLRSGRGVQKKKPRENNGFHKNKYILLLKNISTSLWIFTNRFVCKYCLLQVIFICKNNCLVDLDKVFHESFICFAISCCCFFLNSFSHTYVQSIGLYNMHSLSVKCRRFDTFQLLLPFNGPIKLFHSCPFDQSDDSCLLYSFLSKGKWLSIIDNMFF